MKMLIDCALTLELSDTKERAFEKGDWAGSQAYRRSENPYPKWTELHEWWDAGWSNSMDELCGS